MDAVRGTQRRRRRPRTLMRAVRRSRLSEAIPQPRTADRCTTKTRYAPSPRVWTSSSRWPRVQPARGCLPQTLERPSPNPRHRWTCTRARNCGAPSPHSERQCHPLPLPLVSPPSGSLPAAPIIYASTCSAWARGLPREGSSCPLARRGFAVIDSTFPGTSAPSTYLPKSRAHLRPAMLPSRAWRGSRRFRSLHDRTCRRTLAL